MRWPWRRFFGPDETAQTAASIYEAVVERAREPAFYAEFGVPDTVVGRFDMLALHVFMVLRRLREEPELATALCTELFDDIDRNLREIGVGDLSVGRKVRGFAEGFYGRAGAYDRAVDQGEALADVLRRNLFGGADADADALAALGDYVYRCLDALANQSIRELRRPAFAALPARRRHDDAQPELRVFAKDRRAGNGQHAAVDPD